MKKGIIKGALGLLYPARCPGCDGVLSGMQGSRLFCDECMAQLVPIRGRVCFRCGKPVRSGFSDLCRECEAAEASGRVTPVLQGRGAFVYTDVMKTAMYRLKYSGRRSYAGPLSKAAFSVWGGWLLGLGLDAIIPVPMYREKESVRGYNQAGLLADSLGDMLSVPVYADILVRKRNTIPQKGLNRENRQKNMKNAFKIRQSGVKFSCVLIVDDIYTTGATLYEASSIIKEAFGCRIFSFCICMGAD